MFYACIPSSAKYRVLLVISMLDENISVVIFSTFIPLCHIQSPSLLFFYCTPTIIHMILLVPLTFSSHLFISYCAVPFTICMLSLQLTVIVVKRKHYILICTPQTTVSKKLLIKYHQNHLSRMLNATTASAMVKSFKQISTELLEFV